MDLKLTMVDNANISSAKNYLTVELEGVQDQELLEQLDVKTVVDYFGADLLGEFDKDTVVAHFGITEAEEQ